MFAILEIINIFATKKKLVLNNILIKTICYFFSATGYIFQLRKKIKLLQQKFRLIPYQHYYVHLSLGTHLPSLLRYVLFTQTHSFIILSVHTCVESSLFLQVGISHGVIPSRYTSFSPSHSFASGNCKKNNNQRILIYLN